MNDMPETCSADPVRGRRVAAAVLLVVASLALFEQYLPRNLGDGFLLLLGVGFIVWAALGRKSGLLIPGGILTGIGTGILLRGQYGNAGFLLSMAGGFALISVLKWLIFRQRRAWPFFPAAGLAFSGLTQLGGSEFQHWLRGVGPLWPYGLIVIACYLLLTPPRSKA